MLIKRNQDRPQLSPPRRSWAGPKASEAFGRVGRQTRPDLELRCESRSFAVRFRLFSVSPRGVFFFLSFFAHSAWDSPRGPWRILRRRPRIIGQRDTCVCETDARTIRRQQLLLDIRQPDYQPVCLRPRFNALLTHVRSLEVLIPKLLISHLMQHPWESGLTLKNDISSRYIIQKVNNCFLQF